MLFSYSKSLFWGLLFIACIALPVIVLATFFTKLFVFVTIVFGLYFLGKFFKEDYQSHKYDLRHGIGTDCHITWNSFKKTWQEYKEIKNRNQSS